MKRIITYEHLLQDTGDYGGKIAGIKWLYANEYAIPPGFIIPLGEYEEGFMMLDTVKNIGLPWICRSSIECEDGLSASFAGIFLSKVIHDYSEIPGTIEEIKQSSKSECATKYAERANIKIGNTHILVQSYIEGEISGVYFSDLFGKGPLIEYVSGNCSVLVNGEVNARQIWYTDMLANSINYPRMIEELFRKCDSIKYIYGSDIDIEWTILGNQIYFLQVRPITKEIGT